MGKPQKPYVRATTVGDMLEIQLCPVVGGTVRKQRPFLLPKNDRVAVRAAIETAITAERGRWQRVAK